MDENKPSVSEFFKGKSVFITGASGFLGKVLLEKLLRSCPDLDKIYILMRPKKGKSLPERLKVIADMPLFDVLREQRPKAFNKVHALHGDIRELDLGLSPDDRKTVEDNVSIVFHVAASVRFDDPLREAVIMNVRGTREVMTLACNMKKLQVFAHISTSYCNVDKEKSFEEIYPPHADWRKTIEIAEKFKDTHTLKILTNKYVGKLCNTYTFTKSLAEHVVKDMGEEKFPIVVFRPSIVISTLDEPIKGWIDNLNGPVGILVASGKGIMRSCYCNPDTVADYIPVDIAVKAMILSVWKKGTENENNVSVYNCCTAAKKTITLKEMVDIGRTIANEIPVNDMLWVPGGSVTNSKILHYIKVILLHLFPAILIDTLLKLSGKEPRLLKIQRKIYIANMTLQYFLINQWIFDNKNFLELRNEVLDCDQEDFHYDYEYINVFDYYKNCIIGGRQYLLKEDISTLPQAKIHLRRLYWLDRTVKIIFSIIFIMLILRWSLHEKIYNKVYSYFSPLSNN